MKAFNITSIGWARMEQGELVEIGKRHNCCNVIYEVEGEIFPVTYDAGMDADGSVRLSCRTDEDQKTRERFRRAASLSPDELVEIAERRVRQSIKPAAIEPLAPAS